MLRRLAPAVILAASVAALSACQPPAAEDLTDPRDILGKTIAATAQIRTVTFHAELRVRDANNPAAGAGGPAGGSLDAQVDIPASAARLQGGSFDGQGAFAVISIEGTSWIQAPGTGRWQQMAMNAMDPAALLLFGRGAPGGGPDYAAVLRAAAADPAVAVEFGGVEDCGERRCYRTRVEVPPGQVWPIGSRLLGFDRIPGAPAAPPAADMPAIAIEVLTDTASLRLVELSVGGSLDGSSAEARLQLIEVDQPVSIDPPPPQLVDVAAPGFGGGFAPQPAPVPVEPIEDVVPPAPAP